MSLSKKVGIDIRLWSHPGIGRYTRELVRALIGRRGLECFHFLGYPSDLQILLKDSVVRTYSSSVHSKIYSLSEQLEIPFKAHNFDILHSLHFNIPVLRQRPWVVTVHDLIYLHDAKASKSRLGKPYAEFLFRRIQRSAAAVMTVSEYTKNDLLNLFPKIRPEKVFVTHEAASPFFQKIEDVEALKKIRVKYGLSEPFILFVGSLKDHKNIPVLLRAVESLRAEKKMDVTLVIVGRRDPKNVVLWELIQQKSVFTKYLGEVPDEELAALYNLTEVFVLPSLREGFGLPVLEAMACGAPVIVSDRASLPEIAGAAGLVFDAGHVDDLAGLLYNVLTDQALRRKLSAKGLARAMEFSWKKTADKTLEVYDRVMQ